MRLPVLILSFLLVLTCAASPGPAPPPIHIPMVAMTSPPTFVVPYWLGGFAVTTPTPANWVLPLTVGNQGKVLPGEFLQIRNYGPANITLLTTIPETIEMGPSYTVQAGGIVKVLSNYPNWVVTSIFTATNTTCGVGLICAGTQVSLAPTGTAGTYNYPTAITTDSYGRVNGVTSGSQPVTSVVGNAPLVSSCVSGICTESLAAPGPSTQACQYGVSSFDSTGRLVTCINGSQPITILSNGVGTYVTGSVPSQTVNTYVASVKDYGAKGDGVTDDTAAIQAAFNALSPLSYKKLNFPAGIYLISSCIWFTGSYWDLTGYSAIIYTTTNTGMFCLNVTSVGAFFNNFRGFFFKTVVAPSFPVAISSVGNNGTLVQITTSAPHGLVAGSSIIISGTTSQALNTQWLVDAVQSATQFTLVHGINFYSATGGNVTNLNNQNSWAIRIYTAVPGTGGPANVFNFEDLRATGMLRFFWGDALALSSNFNETLNGNHYFRNLNTGAYGPSPYPPYECIYYATSAGSQMIISDSVLAAGFTALEMGDGNSALGDWHITNTQILGARWGVTVFGSANPNIYKANIGIVGSQIDGCADELVHFENLNYFRILGNTYTSQALMKFVNCFSYVAENRATVASSYGYVFPSAQLTPGVLTSLFAITISNVAGSAYQSSFVDFSVSSVATGVAATYSTHRYSITMEAAGTVPEFAELTHFYKDPTLLYVNASAQTSQVTFQILVGGTGPSNVEVFVTTNCHYCNFVQLPVGSALPPQSMPPTLPSAGTNGVWNVGSLQQNYVSLSGALSGSGVQMSAAGNTDANVGITVSAKGTGIAQLSSTGPAVVSGQYVDLIAQGKNGLVVLGSSTAVNYLQVTAAPTGGGILVLATGSDPNIDLVTKATGNGTLWLVTQGNTLIGSQSPLSTTATRGFLGIPAISGVPSAPPTSWNSAYVGMAYDTVDLLPWYWSPGTGWRSPGLTTISTPASSSAACITGQTSADASFMYICVATNSWRRVALSTF